MNDFRQIISGYFSVASVEMISDALARAEVLLDGYRRYDQRPFVEHAVAVAGIVITEIGLGRNSTISCLMQDAVRMGKISAEEVGRLYGAECESIVRSLCSISQVDTKVSDEQAGNFRDLIVSYATDPRVILIKLADRLEVMRSLSIFPRDKQLKKSWESLNLYATIAHKLGLYSIKSELEDLSLSYLEPEQYRRIAQALKASEQQRDTFIGKFLEPIRGRLDQSGMKYTIKSRTKSIYSIWSKMQRMHIPLEEVYDIFALRIIIDCPKEQEKAQCWGVYSIVTDFYTPNPDRMRDWISIPKSNGYESLHTTVVTKDGHWVEIQIRSERMDAVAERGIAAHWRYKGVRQGGLGSEEWLARLREMMEHRADALEAASADHHPTDEIFIFTPKGDLRKLPAGATMLDFAFDIHTGLGQTCIGGMINHRNVPLKEPLKNGDIVEILTSRNQKPKTDWLNFAVTSKARSKIRTFLREEQAKAANLGREELERRIKNWKLPLTVEEAVTRLCKHLHIKRGIELYGQIVEGRIDLSSLKEVLAAQNEGPQPPLPRAKSSGERQQQDDKPDTLIIEEGLVGGLEYKMGKCCNPIFGDVVFGFVTISSGITIHRANCPNAASLRERYPYRIIEARWRAGAGGGSFNATIRVVADDATGVVNNISDTITQKLRINMRSISLASSERGVISGLINVEVPNRQVADLVVHSILKIKGVQKAYRVNHD
ncbi:GTP pyrophosphokinase [Bacteroidia bacterium]|nr:GTP pyrophosphokinase [Bacteroidia bacterium]